MFLAVADVLVFYAHKYMQSLLLIYCYDQAFDPYISKWHFDRRKVRLFGQLAIRQLPSSIVTFKRIHAYKHICKVQEMQNLSKYFFSIICIWLDRACKTVQENIIQNVF